MASNSHMWKKSGTSKGGQNTKQALFRPQDIYIPHLILYAVHPQLCHGCHVEEGPSITLESRGPEEIERLILDPRFSPTAQIISACTTLSQKDESAERPAVLRTTKRIQGEEFQEVREETWRERERERENGSLLNLQTEEVRPMVRVGVFVTEDPREIADLLSVEVNKRAWGI